MRNILLIVVDTLRADHLGCYGYRRPTSSCIDALARRGVVLDACWSASNFTAPAFTSLFTGVYPRQHGVFAFTRRAIQSPVTAALTEAGMRTAGVVTFNFFEHLLGDIWGPLEVVTQGRSFDYSKELPRTVTQGAVEWLSQHGHDAPFCLFLHYDGPHLPYRLPDEFAEAFDTVAPDAVPAAIRQIAFPQERERLNTGDDANHQKLMRLIRDVNLKWKRLAPDTLQWLIDKYDAAVQYNDGVIGDLVESLANLGFDQNTIICVLSDHGEEFLDHGGFTHGQVGLHEEVIRTAGIIVDPRLERAGRRVVSPVSHVNLLPTLLDLAGVALPPGLAARSCAPLIRGEVDDDPSIAAPVYCHGMFKAAVRAGRDKLIASLPSPHLTRNQRLRKRARMLYLRQHGDEVYDLTADPHERHNLRRDRARTQRLRALLAASLEAGADPGAVADADDAMRAKIEREMKDLGYM